MAKVVNGYVIAPGADLAGANLRFADLAGANLRHANLRLANLAGANLRLAVGNGHEVKTIQTERWQITYAYDVMAIGCQQHTIEEWFAFDDGAIAAMGAPCAILFWRKWKPILQSIMAD